MKLHRVVTILMSIAAGAYAAEPGFTRTEDVVYGRKYGTALTMDVFTPASGANQAAIIWVVSAGMFSSHEDIDPDSYAEYLARGYTVFAVVHGSRPKYTIPEAAADVHRAVRFIRCNAARFGIDPNRIGMTGTSAGALLSLLVGMDAKEGKPDAADPVERVSSRVQAIGCFFPSTDYFNYGEPGRTILQVLDTDRPTGKAPFDFMELDATTGRFSFITDVRKRLDICREISPITHVSADDPPTLLFHGDADPMVPIQQSESMIEKLKAAGVPADLVRRGGGGHGWPGIEKDYKLAANWFDRYLKKARPATQPSSK